MVRGARALFAFGCVLHLMWGAGCDDTDRVQGPRLRLWHTFGPAETEALNAVLEARDGAKVEATILPFSRSRTLLERALTQPATCPDLVRIDATWLPGLVAAGAVAAVPAPMAKARDWLEPALKMATVDGRMMAIPQQLGGLALLYRADSVAAAGALWPPATMGELITAGHRLTDGQKAGLGIQVDGYWFWAFARGFGARLVDESGAITVSSPEAQAALTRFAALFGPHGIAPPPPPRGNAARIHAARFLAGDLAVVMAGPWAAQDLAGGHLERLRVAPFPRAPDGDGAAPLGAQLLAVPACAAHKDAAFALAIDLTDPALQASWSHTLATIPVTRRGLAGSSPLAQDFYKALASARPLPRQSFTPALFDDLSPAVAAVVAGDATAEEALTGVARGWERIVKR